MKVLFRYLIFVGIPYFIAKRLEKYFWEHASPELKKELNKKLKDLPELDTVSEPTKDSLDTRGGANPVILWIVKVIITDFAIKTVIAGGVGASIWSETADNAAAQEEIDLFMVDFTRTQGKDQNYEDLFAAIEEIKNGYIVDMMYGKYEEAIFRPPMIVIFTNQEMKDYKKYLSTDRWVRFVINSDKDRMEYEEGVDESYSPPIRYITPFKVHAKYKLRESLNIKNYQAELFPPPDHETNLDINQ